MTQENEKAQIYKLDEKTRHSKLQLLNPTSNVLHGALTRQNAVSWGRDYLDLGGV